MLEDYAECCQLAGALADAAQRVARARRRRVRPRAWSPTAQRRRAAVLELKGDRELAVKAREAAAAAFEATRRAGRGRGRADRGRQPAPAVRAPRRGGRDRPGRQARTPTAPAASTCASARSASRAWRAPSSTTTRAGLEIVRHGLALALEHDLTAVAAELYQRLSVTLYESADFAGAEEALDAALTLCSTSPDPNVVGACVTCMAYVLRERGEWSRATRMCREMIADGTAVSSPKGLLGAIHAFEGRQRVGAAAAHLVARRRGAASRTTT